MQVYLVQGSLVSAMPLRKFSFVLPCGGQVNVQHLPLPLPLGPSCVEPLGPGCPALEVLCPPPPSSPPCQGDQVTLLLKIFLISHNSQVKAQFWEEGSSLAGLGQPLPSTAASSPSHACTQAVPSAGATQRLTPDQWQTSCGSAETHAHSPGPLRHPAVRSSAILPFGLRLSEGPCGPHTTSGSKTLVSISRANLKNGVYRGHF